MLDSQKAISAKTTAQASPANALASREKTAVSSAKATQTQSSPYLMERIRLSTPKNANTAENAGTAKAIYIQKITKPRSLIYQYSVFLCMAFFIVLLPSLLSYHPNDPAWSFSGTGEPVQNLVGIFGAWISDILLSFVGYASYWFVILSMVVGKDMWHRANASEKTLENMNKFDWVESSTFVVLLICSSIFEAGMLNITGADLPRGKGGMIGQAFAPYLINHMGFSVSALLLFGIITLSIAWFMGFSWLNVCEKIGFYAHVFWEKQWRKEYKLQAQQTDNTYKKRGNPLINPLNHSEIAKETAKESAKNPTKQAELNESTATELTTKATPISIQPIQHLDASLYASIAPKKIFANLPKLDVWQDVYSPNVEEESLRLYSKIIEHRLKGFGIQAEVVSITAGPVLTLYELKLPAGTKAAQLLHLQKDIARELGVIYLNILANIPNKTTIGLELANAERQMIRMRPLVLGMLASSAELPITLGVSANGTPVYIDLTKLLHLLIAGTTGSGKSVCVHSIICSLLAKMLPQHLRLVLIDPKMIEMSAYKNIPHLLTPIITEIEAAQNILDWLVEEMEHRYRQMSNLMVRNIVSYNQKIQDPAWLAQLKVTHISTMPYIVILIDELSDFMMQANKSIELNIVRLAQKARAAGIHLILATQRPTAEVITGLIKANIPGRIALQVPSKLDSRIILDENGAELLLGKGDMLYQGASTLNHNHSTQRIHGVWVDDEEIQAISDFWRKQGTPDYINLHKFM